MTKFSDCQLEQLKDLFKTCFTKSNDRSETSNDQFEQLNESMGLLVRMHRANRAPVSRFDVPRDPLSATLESHLANTKIARV